MASESLVQVPADSSGKKIDARSKSIAGNTVYDQVMAAGKLTKIVDATITRPADTTAYTAGDQVGGAALTFDAIARAAAESGAIVGAICSDSANAATKPQLELWLFNAATAPTAVADNVAWTPSDADVLNAIGVITFTTWYEGLAGAAGNAVAPATLINGIAGGRIPFVCTTVDDIFGLVVVRNAYTPASSEVFKFRLLVEQD